MKFFSDLPKDRIMKKDGSDPSRDLYLWNKKGGAYSRKQLLNIMFFTENNETRNNNNNNNNSATSSYTKKNVRKDGKNGRFSITSYSNWYLSFNEPIFDHRNSDISKRKMIQMYDNDDLETMNEKKEAFSLFAIDFGDGNNDDDGNESIFENGIYENETKIKYGAFFIIPKKVRDFHENDEEFECFWLMVDSRSDTIGSYGEEVLNVVEISPKILHSFFPEPTISQMKSFTKYHLVSKIEIRIREGKYNKMVKHVISSENRKINFSKKNSRKSSISKKRKICVEKIYRSGRMTTGRSICTWV